MSADGTSKPYIIGVRRKRMTCSRCGFVNASGARFCNRCGDRVGEETAGIPITVPPGPTPEVAPTPQPIPQQGFVSHPPGITQARRSAWRKPAGSAQVGIVLMVGSAILPWLSTPGIAAMGIDLPLAFLWDIHAPEAIVTLGILLFCLAGLALLGSVLRPLDVLGRLAGGLAVVAAAVMIFQWRRFLGDMGIEELTLGFIGVGTYAAAGGGLTALLSPGN